MANQFLALVANNNNLNVDEAKDLIEQEFVGKLWYDMKEYCDNWKEMLHIKNRYTKEYLQNVFDCGCYFDGVERIDFMYLLNREENE